MSEHLAISNGDLRQLAICRPAAETSFRGSRPRSTGSWVAVSTLQAPARRSLVRDVHAAGIGQVQRLDSNKVSIRRLAIRLLY